MIGCKEQEPETELSIKHLKLSIAHYFKACCNLFWYGLKAALLIFHTLVDPLLYKFVIKAYGRNPFYFDVVP